MIKFWPSSTTSCLFLSFLFSLFAFYEVALVGCFVYIKLTSWISSEVLNVDWGFMCERMYSIKLSVRVRFGRDRPKSRWVNLK